MDFDLKSLLKTVAPWAATAIGGPLGPVAVGALSAALNLSDKTEQGLKEAITGMSAADLLQLKKADADFAAHMQELGFKTLTDLETVAASDRKSARDMQVATNSRVPAILTMVLTTGMLGLLSAMIFKGMPENSSVQLLIGSYATAWTGSTVYWFGSTVGSLAKTKLLAESQPAK